jgi:membrane protease YdiL (CAAX protease family)
MKRRHVIEFTLACAASVMFIGAVALLDEVPTPRYVLWPWVWLALITPVLEELCFRGLVQTELRQRFDRQFGPISAANLLTSAAFVALHWAQNPKAWVGLVVIPSLVYGYFRDRYDTVKSPIALHLLHNMLYFSLFGLPP